MSTRPQKLRMEAARRRAQVTIGQIFPHEVAGTANDDDTPQWQARPTKPIQHDGLEMPRRETRSKILIIYTGGTFGMKKAAAGHYEPAFVEEEMARIPEINRPEMPLFEVIQWDPPIDSSDMTPAGWVKVAEKIHEVYDQFDGFVVLHGTDTLAYTASALSFMLENLAKPVVLTGAMIPLSEVYNDASRNLIVSMIIAGNLDVPEVCVWFQNHLLRGNRCKKVDSWNIDASFQSPNFPPLATLGTGLQVNYSLIRRPPAEPLRVHTQMHTCIVVVSLTPGFSDDVFEAMAERGNLRALVLMSYGTGNAPSRKQQFLTTIERVVARGIAVVVQSQCIKGFVSLGTYATGVQLQKLGVITSHDMTTEATVTKLSYLLGRGFSGDALKRAMEMDFRGELSQNTNQAMFRPLTAHFSPLAPGQTRVRL